MIPEEVQELRSRFTAVEQQVIALTGENTQLRGVVQQMRAIVTATAKPSAQLVDTRTIARRLMDQVAASVTTVADTGHEDASPNFHDLLVMSVKDKAFKKLKTVQERHGLEGGEYSTKSPSAREVAGKSGIERKLVRNIQSRQGGAEEYRSSSKSLDNEDHPPGQNL